MPMIFDIRSEQRKNALFCVINNCDATQKDEQGQIQYRKLLLCTLFYELCCQVSFGNVNVVVLLRYQEGTYVCQKLNCVCVCQVLVVVLLVLLCCCVVQKTKNTKRVSKNQSKHVNDVTYWGEKRCDTVYLTPTL